MRALLVGGMVLMLLGCKPDGGAAPRIASEARAAMQRAEGVASQVADQAQKQREQIEQQGR